jgi:hypothetical protein
MAFKKDTDGGLRWDKSTAGERWGKKANRPDFIEAAEGIIDRGAVKRIWDTLALCRPDDLRNDEELFVVGKALRRAGELGRLDPNLVAVLLRLLDPPDRLRTENRVNHAAVRAHVRKHRDASLGQLAQKFNITRDTASRIKKQVLSDD